MARRSAVASARSRSTRITSWRRSTTTAKTTTWSTTSLHSSARTRVFGSPAATSATYGRSGRCPASSRTARAIRPLAVPEPAAHQHHQRYIRWRALVGRVSDVLREHCRWILRNGLVPGHRYGVLVRASSCVRGLKYVHGRGGIERVSVPRKSRPRCSSSIGYSDLPASTRNVRDKYGRFTSMSTVPTTRTSRAATPSRPACSGSV